MKAVFLSLLLTGFMFLIPTEEAKAFDLDAIITDADGCEWSIVGEVNLDWKLDVTDYDVTITRLPPCDGVTYHFKGEKDPGSSGYTFELFDDQLSPIALSNIDHMAFHNFILANV